MHPHGLCTVVLLSHASYVSVALVFFISWPLVAMECWYHLSCLAFDYLLSEQGEVSSICMHRQRFLFVRCLSVQGTLGVQNYNSISGYCRIFCRVPPPLISWMSLRRYRYYPKGQRIHIDVQRTKRSRQKHPEYEHIQNLRRRGLQNSIPSTPSQKSRQLLLVPPP